MMLVMLIVNHRPPDITIPWDWIMALAARVFAYLLLFSIFLFFLMLVGVSIFSFY